MGMTGTKPSLSAGPFALPLLVLVVLTAASLALILLSVVLGQSSAVLMTSPAAWFAGLDVQDAFSILSNAAEVVAAVLAVAMTVVAIVVELAANRYSHEITWLFLREPVNLTVLGLFVVTTLQCVWAATVIGDGSSAGILPHAGFALTLGLVTVCLLLLVPYIYFVFTFLSPVSVIERICRNAYRVVERVNQHNVASAQARVEDAVDQLQDVARSAIVHGDRAIAIGAVDAMADLLTNYVRIRDGLPAEWFLITDSVAADPDFVALSEETLADVHARGTWLERKVFRRYLSLVGLGGGQFGDVANVIAINTQRIACELGARHAPLLELCLQAFNSYLRTAINARDARTAYFVMNRLRLVAERLLQEHQDGRAVEIAGYLGEYGRVAYQAGVPFLLETAAYDVMQMVEKALDGNDATVDALLDTLLDLDQEIRGEGEEQSLLGVRRSQIQLATRFLERGEQDRAWRIVDDLRSEPLPRLERLRLGLLGENRSQFWELLDRGANFRYLDPERRPYLDVIFERLRQG